MQALPVAQIKKALRKEQLRRLRTWAKAEPAQVAAESQRVCNHVYDYIMARYRPGHTAPSSKLSTPSHPAVVTPPLFILAYLPLYFEVDLVPLMQRLWQVATSEAIHIMTPVVLLTHFGQSLPTTALSSSSCRSGGSASVAATTTATTAADAAAAAPTSHTLQSAMAFVEVLDDEDLREAFAPQGAYGIREFDSGALAAWLLGPEAAATPPEAPSAQAGRTSQSGAVAPPDGNSVAAAAAAASVRINQETTGHAATAVPPSQHRRRRRVLLCDAYETLFPHVHAVGYRPDGLLEYRHHTAGSIEHTSELSTGSAEAHSDPAAPTAAGVGGAPVCSLSDASVLVLSPGVLFDVQTGGRLGKGGGFYDRFLAYHSRERRHRASPSDAASHPPATTTLNVHQVGEAQPPTWEVMAVAFDEQVLHLPRSATVAMVSGGGRGVEAAAAPLGRTSHTSPASLVSSGSVSTSMPERIPVDAHDQQMHCVASPSGGVEQVWEVA